ncbi:MAG TPA: hypothetical protein VEC35_17490 [Noviherbaspirillum sp.]|nr:hypothetical protein [Noviherbaspirillum sp.]
MSISRPLLSCFVTGTDTEVGKMGGIPRLPQVRPAIASQYPDLSSLPEWASLEQACSIVSCTEDLP